MASTLPPMANVSEPSRERETLKYESSLFTAIKHNNSGEAVPDSELSTSTDSVLTALAQLAACQTKTDRAFISLFDQTHQYYVAEATPTLSVFPNLNRANRNEDLWMCRTAIPRVHGVCEYTLQEIDAEQFYGAGGLSELPVMTVGDLTTDPRFSCKPYCQPGSPARFYAACPIRTRRGINIGVFCVFKDKPDSHWEEGYSSILRSLSRTVMYHLEATRLKSAQRRSERMTRGIGSFIEGSSTLSAWQMSTERAAYLDDPDMEGGLNTTQQLLRGDRGRAAQYRENSVAKSETKALTASPVQTNGSEEGTHLQGVGSQSTEANGSAEPAFDQGASPNSNGTRTPRPRDFTAEVPATERKTSEAEKVDHDSVSGIYSKAANLIRESIEIEGCLFLDPGRSVSGGNPTSRHHDPGPRSSLKAAISSSSGSSDDDKAALPTQLWPTAKVLGYSTSESSSIDERLSPVGKFPQKLLAKLIRRYPDGHIFHFDAKGALQSSDSSEDDDIRARHSAKGKSLRSESSGDISEPDNETAKAQGTSKSKPWSRQNEGRSILEAFPDARSVAFVPVWDPRKERWCAAGFAYTNMATRIFTVHNELSYLKAFATLVAAETLRLETIRADKAKSDTLGSLSHELRSPLHGIVLGAELLNDTSLDVLQSNILHTIEVCCRTLTDTVDHLLEYSKVNMRKKSRSMYTRNRPGRSRSIEDSLKNLQKHIQLDVLVEEVVESVYTGFNFQHFSIAQLSKEKPVGKINGDVAQLHRIDSMKAMEDLGPDALNLGQVSISVVVDHSCSWLFDIEPGAIRRIIMNVFGNALKYTTRGTIKLTLTQAFGKGPRSKDRFVNITVADTGRGISEDFLQHGIFKPFSQEDSLSPGTGLGLSFVKQITSQLGGQISIRSKVGTGTTVTVSLPLTPTEASFAASPEAVNADSEFRDQVRELQGLRVRVLGFDEHRSSLESLTREWLRMQTMTDHDATELVPDLVIRSERSLSQVSDLDTLGAKSPCVVICANALSAYQHNAQAKGRPGAYEFISQPVGPRKLARTLSLLFSRWTEAQENAASPTRGSDGNTIALPVRVLSRQSSPQVSPHPTPQPSPMPSLLPSWLGTVQETPPQGTVTQEPMTNGASQPVPMFLLVEDNRINMKILTSYMNKLKRPYQTATNGQEALDAYTAQPGQFRCVLMDISMPVMDGFEATRRIRAFEHENRLEPALVLALSGLASESAAREASESGLDLFLSKPVMLKELGAILDANGLLKTE